MAISPRHFRTLGQIIKMRETVRAREMERIGKGKKKEILRNSSTFFVFIGAIKPWFIELKCYHFAFVVHIWLL